MKTTTFTIPCVPKDEVISLLEDKQRDLCPPGRFGRGYVYGSDREEFDRWQELIDAVERMETVGVVQFPASSNYGCDPAEIFAGDISLPDNLL